MKLNHNRDTHSSFSEDVQFKQTNNPKDNEVYGCPHLISKMLRDNERNDDTTLIKTSHWCNNQAKDMKLNLNRDAHSSFSEVVQFKQTNKKTKKT